ncbi:Cyclin-A2 [Paramecium bursaria]
MIKYIIQFFIFEAKKKKKYTKKRLEQARIKHLQGVHTIKLFYMQPISLSRLKTLLGLGDCKVEKKPKSKPTFEQRATQTSPSTPMKKVKCLSQETTRNLQDIEDLYCYEQDKKVQMPTLKHQYVVDKSYILQYQDYNENIRAIVLSKIIDNCETFSIDYGHIAIDLFDRFLSKRTNKVVCQGELRLLSLACILLAGKISKLPPRIQDILRLTTIKFTREQLLKCEQSVIRVLDWNLNPVTLKDFLDEALIRYQNYYHDSQRKIYLDTTDLYRIVNVVTLDHNYLSYNRAEIAFSIILEYYNNDGEDFLICYGLTRQQLMHTRCYIQPIVKVVKLKKDTHVFELWKIIN